MFDEGYLVWILVFPVGWIICMAFNPVIWQTLRNARYVDKLKAEKKKREALQEAMPDIPEPDEENKDVSKHGA